MDYKILRAGKIFLEDDVLDRNDRIPRQDLEKKVKEAMSEGWKPQGGVSCCVDNSGDGTKMLFFQAMVK